uniref:Uncharacterized protein n=1 Tax=Leersia perrieri TaxID=77586 RepID=A0A0D9Y0R3_9ORYZ
MCRVVVDFFAPSRSELGVVEKLKALWDSQVNDEEAWPFNYLQGGISRGVLRWILGAARCGLVSSSLLKLMKAGGLFVASIFVMRNFGDLMAI